MINRANHFASMDAELCNGMNSADTSTSSGRIKNAIDEALRIMELERTAIPTRPKGMCIVDARALEAYIERRRKLATRIREENPSCTEEYIEARLEQFGA